MSLPEMLVSCVNRNFRCFDVLANIVSCVSIAYIQKRNAKMHRLVV